MGKIKKIKAERKKAEVEAQINKMKRNRLFIRSGLILSLILILSWLGFFGYKYADRQWQAGDKIKAVYSKYFKKEEEKEQKVERKTYNKVPDMQIDAGKNYEATLNTSKGEIKIQLNAKEVPNTVNNFVVLSRDHFYDDVVFHRIIKEFMIQTGDPEGTGAGGPGYKFDDEKVSGDYVPGTVAMANSGANTNGSQFFIMTGDYSGKLPKNYTIFGKVISGMETVEAIANVNTIDNGQGEQSKPTEEVKILKVTIEEK